MRDWLFQWPEHNGTWRGLCDAVEAELGNHPDAAALSDDEAEQFVAVAWALLKAGPVAVAQICHMVGVVPLHGTQRSVRRNIVAVLRTWPAQRHRELLVKLPRFLGIGRLREIVRRPERYSWQMLADAWVDGDSIVWITQVMRATGHQEEIPAFLEQFGDRATLERRALVASGKLIMKRVVWQGRATAQAQAERQAQQSRFLRQRLRQQESALKSLESDLAQVAQRRDALRQAAQNAQANARALLEQARAEAAAAEAELAQRQAAHAREITSLVGRCESRIQELSQRLTDLRLEQAAALRERGRNGMGPLTGLTFSVTGLEADPQGCRALIESAGGRVVKEGAQVQIAVGSAGEGPFDTRETGLAGLERVIRSQVAPRLLELRAGRK